MPYAISAVGIACHFINRLPVAACQDKTPIEMVTGSKRFVLFYAPGAYNLTREERQGMTWRHQAATCRMLGYSGETDGAWLSPIVLS